MRQRRLLCRDVDTGDLSQLLLLVQQSDQLAFGLDDILGRGDLTAQRGLLDRAADDIRGQRQIRRLQLEALRLGLCRQRFDVAPVQPQTSGEYDTASWVV